LISLFGILDSVARPIVQNRLQFNSYWGCSCYMCHIYGKYDNCSIRFPIDLNKDVEIRSHESHMHDVEYVMNKKK